MTIDNSLSALSMNLLSQAGQSATTATGQAKSASSMSFQQLMTLMMSSSMTSSLGGGGGGSGIDSFVPLLFGMMEQLLQMQLSSAEAASQTTPATAGTSAAAGAQAVDTGQVYGSSKPAGRPVGGSITNYFRTGHNGLDFGIPMRTPIHATMDGKVVYAGWNNEGYGNLVIVENGPYRTFYAHLSEIPVSYGQTVKAGSVVGLSGSTGNSTGPHLHYEVRYEGRVIDPTPFTL